MSIDDPKQLKFDFAHEGENVADSATPPSPPHPSTPLPPPSPHSPGPMSAREDHAPTTLQRQRETLAQQARAGDRTALRRYLQLRRR